MKKWDFFVLEECDEFSLENGNYYSHYFIKTYGMKEEETQDGSPFKKGMTLNEYFGELQVVKDENSEEKTEENLYQTSQKNQFSVSKKLITYEIRQIDEDNYDEEIEDDRQSLQKSQKLSNHFHQPIQRESVIKASTNKTEMNSELGNSRGFRVRKQSNSPYTNLKKESSSLSPNKNIAKTLYNNEWKLGEKQQKYKGMGSSTLYGKFLKGIKERKNEKYFKKKNTKELDYVIKYQQNRNLKYTKFNTDEFRIQGITDRLHERKPYRLNK